MHPRRAEGGCAARVSASPQPLAPPPSPPPNTNGTCPELSAGAARGTWSGKEKGDCLRLWFSNARLRRAMAPPCPSRTVARDVRPGRFVRGVVVSVSGSCPTTGGKQTVGLSGSAAGLVLLLLENNLRACPGTFRFVVSAGRRGESKWRRVSPFGSFLPVGNLALLVWTRICSIRSWRSQVKGCVVSCVPMTLRLNGT